MFESVSKEELSHRELAKVGGGGWAQDQPQFAERWAGLNANPQAVVDYFDGQVGKRKYILTLSNFYIGEPIQFPEIDGESLPAGLTGEHVFQAFKATDRQTREAILTARYEEGDVLRPGSAVGDPAPAKAKAMGRSISLRPDWEAVKFDVMAMTVRLKTSAGRLESLALLNTGSAYLQEGSWHGDTVWGVDLQKEARPGRNWLGTILMARRAELVATYYQALRVPPTEVYNLIYAGS